MSEPPTSFLPATGQHLLVAAPREPPVAWSAPGSRHEVGAAPGAAARSQAGPVPHAAPVWRRPGDTGGGRAGLASAPPGVSSSAIEARLGRLLVRGRPADGARRRGVRRAGRGQEGVKERVAEPHCPAGIRVRKKGPPAAPHPPGRGRAAAGCGAGARRRGHRAAAGAGGGGNERQHGGRRGAGQPLMRRFLLLLLLLLRAAAAAAALPPVPASPPRGGGGSGWT